MTVGAGTMGIELPIGNGNRGVFMAKWIEMRPEYEGIQCSLELSVAKQLEQVKNIGQEATFTRGEKPIYDLIVARQSMQTGDLKQFQNIQRPARMRHTANAIHYAAIL